MMPPHDTYIETQLGGGAIMQRKPAARRYRDDCQQQDHVELLRLLKSLPCAVLLSGYPSALYDEWLPDWQTIELQVSNQAGVRTEKLWFNYPLDRVH